MRNQAPDHTLDGYAKIIESSEREPTRLAYSNPHTQLQNKILPGLRRGPSNV